MKSSLTIVCAAAIVASAVLTQAAPALYQRNEDHLAARTGEEELSVGENVVKDFVKGESSVDTPSATEAVAALDKTLDSSSLSLNHLVSILKTKRPSVSSLQEKYSKRAKTFDAENDKLKRVVKAVNDVDAHITEHKALSSPPVSPKSDAVEISSKPSTANAAEVRQTREDFLKMLEDKKKALSQKVGLHTRLVEVAKAKKEHAWQVSEQAAYRERQQRRGDKNVYSPEPNVFFSRDPRQA